MDLVQECVFCKIVRREIPSKIVAETENVFAFFDVKHDAPIHVLIVPKIHIASVNDLKPENNSLIGEMVFLAKEIAREQKIDVSGFRLVLNTGPASGQSVFHVHLHLLGGREMGWPPG